MPLGDIFVSSLAEHAILLSRNEIVKKSLSLICEVKQLGEDCFYRFDKNKCVQWLKGRVQKTEAGMRFVKGVTLIALFTLWEKKNPEKSVQGVKALCHIEAVRLVCRLLSDDLQNELLAALK